MRALLLVVLLVACGPGSRPGDGSGGDDDGNGADVDGGAAVEACPNVDLLFVIDDSGSMADQQESLIASFPGFVAGIQQRLGNAQSYHIGVVTTEDYQANRAGCRQIGDLITHTGGPASSMSACGPFANGQSWMGETEPNLAQKFACAGKVGAGGSSDERIARAIMNALEPARNAPGACNAGFSRPESLLVIVIITDEDDVADGCTGTVCDTYGSGGTSTDWYNTIVAHRGGFAQNIVVLSLIARQLANACGATPAARLIGFTNKFDERGFIGDVCASSYDQFFLDALPVIDSACQNWDPIY
ncbi:MAG: hypothetical protein ACKV2T_12105 [Kofleriaceae bacterium]